MEEEEEEIAEYDMVHTMDEEISEAIEISKAMENSNTMTTIETMKIIRTITNNMKKMRQTMRK